MYLTSSASIGPHSEWDGYLLVLRPHFT